MIDARFTDKTAKNANNNLSLDQPENRKPCTT